MPDVWADGRLPTVITENRLNFEWAEAIPTADKDVSSRENGGK